MKRKTQNLSDLPKNSPLKQDFLSFKQAFLLLQAKRSSKFPKSSSTKNFSSPSSKNPQKVLTNNLPNPPFIRQRKAKIWTIVIISPYTQINQKPT